MVKSHTDKFPRIEPHYCRKDSTQQYLSPELNIAKMYDLYVNDFCIRNDIQNVASARMYRTIFLRNYNLRHFVPKKDQCCVRNAYYNGTAEYKTTAKPSWDEHKQREIEAMTAKSRDKEFATKNENFVAVMFDLQAVLCTPHAGDSQIFYKRKLAVYNLTVDDSQSHTGHCFLGDETEGKRGANEVGTALFLYMKGLSRTVTHVSTFSDTCASQNRNKYIAALMLYAVQNLPSINCVDMKFTVSGHSYLEADSMHATIEHARHHHKIYTTREWKVLIHGCRRKPRPYNISVLHHNDVLDIKRLCGEIVKNTNRAVDGSQWTVAR